MRRNQQCGDLGREVIKAAAARGREGSALSADVGEERQAHLELGERELDLAGKVHGSILFQVQLNH